MAEVPRLVSLDQFRRKKPLASEDAERPVEPPTSPTTDVAETPPRDLHPRTERRAVAAVDAIEKLKRRELAAIAAAPSPKNHRVLFSAAAVAREAGIGRTQLYEGHARIREAIEAARAEIEAALQGRRNIRRPVSKRALEERNAALETHHEAEIRRLASQHLSDLIRRLGPSLEAAQRGAASLKMMENENRQLREQLAGQTSVINVLRKALEDAQGKGQ